MYAVREGPSHEHKQHAENWVKFGCAVYEKFRVYCMVAFCQSFIKVMMMMTMLADRRIHAAKKRPVSVTHIVSSRNRLRCLLIDKRFCVSLDTK